MIVSRKKFDLMAVQISLIGLMYPFEWELPTIPFLWSDPDYPNFNLFPLINNMMSNIIGIHETAYNDMKMTAAGRHTSDEVKFRNKSRNVNLGMA